MPQNMPHMHSLAATPLLPAPHMPSAPPPDSHLLPGSCFRFGSPAWATGHLPAAWGVAGHWLEQGCGASGQQGAQGQGVAVLAGSSLVVVRALVALVACARLVSEGTGASETLDS